MSRYTPDVRQFKRYIIANFHKPVYMIKINEPQLPCTCTCISGTYSMCYVYQLDMLITYYYVRSSCMCMKLGGVPDKLYYSLLMRTNKLETAAVQAPP